MQDGPDLLSRSTAVLLIQMPTSVSRSGTHTNIKFETRTM